MKNAHPKEQHRAVGGRIGFQLAETMAAVSQMSLLCPGGLDAWMRRELIDSGRAPTRPERHQ